MMYQNDATKTAWQFTPERQKAWQFTPERQKAWQFTPERQKAWQKPRVKGEQKTIIGLNPLGLKLTLGTTFVEQVRQHKVLKE